MSEFSKRLRVAKDKAQEEAVQKERTAQKVLDHILEPMSGTLAVVNAEAIEVLTSRGFNQQAETLLRILEHILNERV